MKYPKLNRSISGLALISLAACVPVKSEPPMPKGKVESKGLTANGGLGQPTLSLPPPANEAPAIAPPAVPAPAPAIPAPLPVTGTLSPVITSVPAPLPVPVPVPVPVSAPMPAAVSPVVMIPKEPANCKQIKDADPIASSGI
ncbi:MAG: hypothetical protein EOP10_34365, partial [Proteobacteria bacterium]